jgi:hypothetical protein
MAGAALPVSGMALGYLIIQGSRAVPEMYVVSVGNLGLALLASSVLIFIVVTGGFAWLWLRQVHHSSPSSGARN